MTAYSPLGCPGSAAFFKRAEGVPRVLEDPVVNKIARRIRIGRSAGQVKRERAGPLGAGGQSHRLWGLGFGA